MAASTFASPASLHKSMTKSICLASVKQLQTVTAVTMGRCGHNSVVKKTKKLHQIISRCLEDAHIVREIVRHLKDLALVGSGAKGCN